MNELGARKKFCINLVAIYCCFFFLTAICQAEDPSDDDNPIVKSDKFRSPIIEVFSSSSCTCCRNWIKYMERSGFSVTDTRFENMPAIKLKHKIPNEARSCHTALIEGYIIEGHVPVEDILWLLEKRPNIKGLSVPGMVTGPPGMEGPEPQDYSVMIIENDGTTKIHKTYKVEE